MPLFLRKPLRAEADEKGDRHRFSVSGHDRLQQISGYGKTLAKRNGSTGLMNTRAVNLR